MLGHACETMAVMYLQRGPLSAENETTTHRTHRTHRLLCQMMKESKALRSSSLKQADKQVTVRILYVQIGKDTHKHKSGIGDTHIGNTQYAAQNCT